MNLLPPNLQIERLKRGTVEIISEEELKERIEKSQVERRPLRVKAGFDPTTKDIHLGHTVILQKLRTFQDLGHVVYLIVGDFTARIGDPSGRNEARPYVDEKTIEENARTYTEQAFKILDKRRTRVFFNSSWYGKMSLRDILNVLRRYTVARMLERDDFSRRMQEQRPISMLEFIYPLLQGYDSVKIEADIELGGTDQKFNLIVGRTLQSSFGQKPQVVITLPLLVGLDGKNKMSKSLGNYIGITEKAEDIFGKVMSLSDELMYEYFNLLTDRDLGEVKSYHPKQAKELLASLIVERFYNKEEAERQRERFNNLFSRKKTDKIGLPQVFIAPEGNDIFTIAEKAGVNMSRNQIRRLIQQGGVSFNDSKIKNEKTVIKSEGVLRLGKKVFLEIKIS